MRADKGIVAKYKIFYGDKWQGTYRTQLEAEQAAEFEAQHRDEIVAVIKTSLFGNRFVTAFPVEERERARAYLEAIQTWKGSSPSDYVRGIRWGR